MATSEVKLLGKLTSPYVNRVQISLNLNTIDYEFIEENLEHKNEFLLKSNPLLKKIPVLIHGDKPICESLLIVQYIDEAWTKGPSILPFDPYDHATARFWAAYIDDKWLRMLEIMVEVKLLTEAKTLELLGWVERFCANDDVNYVLPEPAKLIIEILRMRQARENLAVAANNHLKFIIINLKDLSYF